MVLFGTRDRMQPYRYELFLVTAGCSNCYRACTLAARRALAWERYSSGKGAGGFKKIVLETILFLNNSASVFQRDVTAAVSIVLLENIRYTSVPILKTSNLSHLNDNSNARLSSIQHFKELNEHLTWNNNHI